MEPVMMDVLEEHLDEAAFLWSQWEIALMSARHDLADTAECEERLLAHVEGLVIGGEAAVGELLLPGLETDERERISAAALTLLAGNGKKELEELLEVLDSGDEVQRAGVGRAMEVSEREGLDAALLRRLTAEEPALRALAFQVLAFRGAVPQEKRTEWLYKDEAGPVIAALRDARPLPRDVVQTLLPQLLVDPRPGVRAAAMMAGLVSGARAAWKACHKVAEEGGVGRQQCLAVLALGGDERDLELLTGLLRQEALRADVLWALGFSGQALAAEACLEWMDDDKVAALAGEAFSAITGLKLEREYRKAAKEESESLIPLEEEDLDANLVPGPEASLPIPVREAVERWWQKAQKGFERGARYLRGNKLDADRLVEALGSEPMRRRPVLALELAIRSRGALLLQTRAFTHRQRAELRAALAGRTAVSMNAFSKLFGL
ncbi:MAG TPA: TIGR02270 family protein [Hyalangium sp.]|nr:TIGR02270 family protein [Hyalangium sp.]